MPHLSREWRRHFSADPDRVQLAYDEGNAHNEVDRHTFLTRMREICPGICKWLEYIYPTGEACKEFCPSMIIKSRAGGQQGCPLMMACHAMVQRMMLESLGVVEPPVGTQISVPVMDPPAALDMTPCFADDGILAGPSAEVLRSLKHLKVIMPRLGLRFSSLVVSPAASSNHHVDFGPLVGSGCMVEESGNIEVLKSPVGSEEVCQAFSFKIVAKHVRALSKVAELPDAQVSCYSMRWSCDASRVNYLARTTPADHCIKGLSDFDAAMRATFIEASGLPLDDHQWQQASLSVKQGVLD